MRKELFLVELQKFFIFRLLFLSAVWPLAIWFYPTQDLLRGAKEGFQWLNWALSMAISMILPGMAKAQQKRSVYEGNTSQICALSTNNHCISDPPKVVTKTVYSVEAFADTRHDAQVFFRVNRGKFLLVNQNRTTISGESKFSHVGLGIKIKPTRNITTSFTYGPQFTYEKERIDRTVLFATAIIGNNAGSITAVNRLSFGHVSKTSFSNRHLQIIKQRYLPTWLKLQAEELYSNGKWREWFFGTNINLGELLKFKGFLKNTYAYPMWDAAKGNFDIRVGFTHAF